MPALKLSPVISFLVVHLKFLFLNQALLVLRSSLSLCGSGQIVRILYNIRSEPGVPQSPLSGLAQA